MLPLWAWVDLGSMAMKVYSAFPKAPAFTGTSSLDCLVSYLGQLLTRGVLPLRREAAPTDCTIKWTREGQKNGPKNKKVDDNAHDIDRFYVSRKEGGRRLARIERMVDISIRGLDEYIKKNKERFITAAISSNNNIDRLYVLRKEGGRGVSSSEIARIHQYEDLNTT